MKIKGGGVSHAEPNRKQFARRLRAVVSIKQPAANYKRDFSVRIVAAHMTSIIEGEDLWLRLWLESFQFD